MKFIIWKDGGQADAQSIEAADMPQAIETAAELLGVDVDQVNIIDAARVGEAEYYGVAHALES